MRKLLLAALLAVAPASAYAKSFALPDEKPVASITIPDSWEPEEIENGVQVTSPDSTIYIAVEVVDAADLKAASAEGIKFFQKSGVTVDGATLKEDQGTLNGMGTYQLAWKGRDKDGPTNVSLILVDASPTKKLIVSYWGNDKGAQDNAAAVSAMAQSVKPIR